MNSNNAEEDQNDVFSFDFGYNLQKSFTEKHQKLISIIDSIFEIKKENVNYVKESIDSYNKNLTYIVNAIKYALKICPKQRKALSSLLLKLGVSDNNMDHISIFLSREYDYSIINDDIKSFKEFISKKSFNFKKKVFVHRNDPIFYVNKDRHVSYLQHMAFCGAINCFKFALNDCRFDSSDLSKYAVAGGNYEIIKTLKERGEDFNNCYRISVKFHRNKLWDEELSEYKKESFYLSKIQKYFNDKALLQILKEKSNKTKKCSITNTKIEALKTGNLEMIKYLKIDGEERYFGESPLHIATKYQHIDVIKFFIKEQNSNINESDYKGILPLQIAADKSNMELIKFFYDDCNAKIGNINEHALINAVNKGTIELIDYLLYTWKLKNVEKCSLSLLSIAARRGDLDIFKLILKYFEFSTDKMNEALFIASENCNLNIIKYLIDEFNVDTSKISPQSLQNAVKKGNSEAVKFLIENCDASLKIDTYYGTLLIIATKYYSNDEYMKIIEYLIEEQHVDINEKDYYKKTALHIATEETNINLVKYFVEKHHANIHAKDLNDESPFSIAKKKGDLDLISYFNEKDVESKNRNVMDIQTRIATNEGDFDLLKKYSEGNEIFLSPTLLIIAAEKENLEIIKYLIEECNFDVEIEDEFGRTPLFISVEKGNLKIVKYLVEECKADPEIECISRKTPLHIASEKGFVQIVKYLTEFCHTKISRRDKFYQTPLELSIKAKNVNKDLVKYIYNKSPEIAQEVDYDERNLLHVVAEKNDVELMEYVKNNFNNFIEGKDYKNKTPLIHAIEKGNMEQVKYLVEKCSVNTETIKDDEIVLVTDNNNLNMVEYVYNHSSQNIESKDKFGQTPLLLAIQRGNLDIVKYLVEECKANIEEKNQFEDIPLHVAAKACKISIFNYLAEIYRKLGKIEEYSNIKEFKNSKEIHIKYANIILDFIKNNPTLTLDMIYQRSADILINNGDIGIVKYFYGDCNEDVDKKDENGRAALHIACEIGNFEIVKFLYESCNAFVETTDLNVKTPLCYAIENNHFRVFKYLCSVCHANIEKKDKCERTALCLACNNSNFGMVKYLIKECHANVEAKEENGRTPLHIATENGDLDIIKYLIKECNADLSAEDNEFRKSLQISCESGHLDVLKYFIDECGEKADEKTGYDDNLAFYASKNGHLDVIKYLVENWNISVTEKDNEDVSALLIACEKGYLDIVKYCVEECHANVRRKADYGGTALHFACSKGRINVIKYLIEECHVNINSETKIGFSPLDNAIYDKNINVIKYLVETCHANFSDDNIKIGNDEIKKYFNKRRLLHESAENGDILTVKRLIEVEKYFADQKYNGRTILHIATKNGNLELMKYLIEERYVNIEEKENDGKTIMQLAKENGNQEIIDYLVEECYLNPVQNNEVDLSGKMGWFSLNQSESSDDDEEEEQYSKCSIFGFKRNKDPLVISKDEINDLLSLI